MALLERLGAAALHPGADAAAAAACEAELASLCRGIAGAQQLRVKGLDGVLPAGWDAGGDLGPAGTIQAVDSALRNACEALGAGSAEDRGGAEPYSARRALACRLLRLAVEGESDSGGGGGGGGAAAVQVAGLLALDALPWGDIAALPGDALSAALLLRPELVDRLLSDIARSCCDAQGSSATAASSRPGGGSGGSGVPSLSHALGAHPPWVHLPGVLASQPAVFARVRDTLLSWWQLSGHPRLWQLLSAACRPAWQLLLAPPTEQRPESGRLPQPDAGPRPQRSKPAAVPGGTQAGGSGGCGVDMFAERLPSGCVELCFCGGAPLQLAQLLLQTPTRAALRQLLTALPGRAAAANSGPGAGAGAAAAAGSMEGGSMPEQTGNGAAGGCALDLDSGWPDEAAWGLAWECDGQQEARAGRGRGAEVASAWRLAMQHLCWYEYACWVLAHSSLRLRMAPPPQQPRPQQEQPRQPLPPSQPRGQTQGGGGRRAGPKGGGKEDPQGDASAAAELIAWVVAPADPSRQAALHSQLVACATSGSDRQAQGADESTLDAAAAPPAATAEAAAQGLLRAWREAGGASRGAWPWWLAGADLPAALMRHPAPLLQPGCGARLLAKWLPPPAAAESAPPASAAEPSERGTGLQQAAAAGAPRPAAALAPPQRMLRGVQLGQALDALDALAEAGMQLLHSEVSQALGGTQGAEAGAAAAPRRTGGGSGGSGAQGKGKRRGWLESCVRHALVSGAGAGAGEQPAAGSAAAPHPPLVAQLRQLLAAVQACHDAATGAAAALEAAAEL